jgi:hypothetical protein
MAVKARNHWMGDQLLDVLARVKFAAAARTSPDAFAEFVHRELSAATRSTGRRQVRALSAGRAVRHMTATEREGHMDAVRRLWRREFEPETKFALVLVVTEAAREQPTRDPGRDHFPE